MSGAHAIDLKEAKLVDGLPFPLTLAPDEEGAPAADLAAFITTNRSLVLQQVAAHGAVLLRGWTSDAAASAYPVSKVKRRGAPPSADTFAAAVAALNLSDCDMACSSAPRKAVTVSPAAVYTSNEAPPAEKIPFHHEMAQCPDQPAYIAFFCEVPPAAGGQTPILPSVWAARYLRSAHPELAERLAVRGVRYVRIMPATTDETSPLGRSWQSTLGAASRDEAQAALGRMQMSFEWLEPHGDLKAVSKPMVALERHEGRELFYNAIVAAIEGWADSRNDSAKAIVYGDDGAALTSNDVAALIDVAMYMRSQQVGPLLPLARLPPRRLLLSIRPTLYPYSLHSRPLLLVLPQVAFEWQMGDVLLLDNKQAMHSRASFTPPRRILAAVGGPPADTVPPPMPLAIMQHGRSGRDAAGDAVAKGMPRLVLRSHDEMPVVGLGLWKIPRDATADSVYASSCPHRPGTPSHVSVLRQHTPALLCHVHCPATAHHPVTAPHTTP